MATWTMQLVHRGGLVALSAGLAGCGLGAQLERAPGVPRFKPLAPRATVQMVESSDVLAQPALVLGVLRTTTTRGEQDRPAVQTQLKKDAARYGCDAVVGLAARDEVTTSVKTVEKLGDGGKPIRTQETVERRTWHWQAECVRSALLSADPGGKTTVQPVAATPAAPVPEPIVAAEGPPTTPEGKAAKEIAELLLERRPFVRAFSGALERDRPESADVVDALVETMVQVTGPTGLWRKTLPQEWFGCPANPDAPACGRLSSMDNELRGTDSLHREASEQARSQSPAWLRHNQDRVAAYLQTYVPAEPSLAAIQATPYYLRRLADVAP